MTVDNQKPATKISGSGNLDRVKAIVFYSFNDEDALAVLRMLGPAKLAGLEVIHGVKDRSVDIDAVNKGDLVVIQREFGVDYNSYEKVIANARLLEKPVILDLDDLILALPEDHPDRLAGNFSPALLPLLQTIIEADLVTVPTAHLREYLLPYNPSIEIIPNYLDDSLWSLIPPRKKVDSAEPIIIGYMGGHSHAPDLSMILPALMQLVKIYPQNRIRFQFWGIEPPAELVPYSKVDWFPPPSRRYSDFAEYFQRQEMDIAITPLGDNLFNSCKSSIKFLEYTAIGAPGVYSRVAPYADVIENEIDGMLAATTEEWISALGRLIESVDLRGLLIGNAQHKVNQSWMLSKNADKRAKIYSELVSNYRREGKTYPPFFELEKTITRQLYEEHLRNYHSRQQKDDRIQYLTRRGAEQDNLIQSLNGKISNTEFTLEQMNQHVTDLENEVVSYATSKSWRWTRPFRKIFNKW